MRWILKPGGKLNFKEMN